jgi:hypothetical protein
MENILNHLANEFELHERVVDPEFLSTLIENEFEWNRRLQTFPSSLCTARKSLNFKRQTLTSATQEYRTEDDLVVLHARGVFGCQTEFHQGLRIVGPNCKQ